MPDCSGSVGCSCRFDMRLRGQVYAQAEDLVCDNCREISSKDDELGREAEKKRTREAEEAPGPNKDSCFGPNTSHSLNNFLRYNAAHPSVISIILACPSCLLQHRNSRISSYLARPWGRAKARLYLARLGVSGRGNGISEICQHVGLQAGVR